MNATGPAKPNCLDMRALFGAKVVRWAWRRRGRGRGRSRGRSRRRSGRRSGRRSRRRSGDKHAGNLASRALGPGAGRAFVAFVEDLVLLVLAGRAFGTFDGACLCSNLASLARNAGALSHFAVELALRAVSTSCKSTGGAMLTRRAQGALHCVVGV